MQIPQTLAAVLRQDSALDGAVRLSIAEFEPWIKHSHLPFFPEYTDHGIDHIEGVLRTAAGLIADDAWDVITPGDAAVLTLSVLLHDCAMHLSEDGFFALIEPKGTNRSIVGLADRPWPELWEGFIAEARRFDERTLTRLFGDTEPVTRPTLHPNKLTRRDRLLIGEFLRRHHPRLAHEIALWGVPMTAGQGGLVLKGLESEHRYIAELAGIVARSHGEGIRARLPYLRDHFDVRGFKGVHAVFLMALVRVADYLQLEAERAPSQTLRTRQLVSPVSQGEWRAHHAIRDIRHTHDDPESLVIDALPEDAYTYFRLRAWLIGIQAELDASWATLGEVYGRLGGLKSLGLVLRRVRSTLDKPGLVDRLPYEPIRAELRTSAADVLKLLVGPLYDNDPAVGIRELVQNSLDAVRELKYLSTKTKQRSARATQRAEITVEIKDTEDGMTLWIRDSGIGMTAETVANYYLTAGASYRRNPAWTEAFEDASGASQVLRSGRFGVGVLAAFLLGPEIKVSTRHVSGETGFEFSVSLNSELIELRRCRRPIGTDIEIRVAPEAAEKLRANAHLGQYGSDWYCLSKPKVLRRVNGRQLRQRYRLPDAGAGLPPQWHRIVSPQFADVMWAYLGNFGGMELVCNGIVVGDGRKRSSLSVDYSLKEMGIRLPCVSVMDPDAYLPLNLQRTGLAGTYPFQRELIADVVRDYLAFALVAGPVEPFESPNDSSYPGLDYSLQDREQSWYFTPDGFGIVGFHAFKSQMLRSLLLARDGAGVMPAVLGPTVVGKWEARDEEKIGMHFLTLGNKGSTFRAVSDMRLSFPLMRVLALMSWRGIRVILHKELDRIGASGGNERRARKEWAQGEWSAYSVGRCPKSSTAANELLKSLSGRQHEHRLLVEFYPGNVRRDLEEAFIGDEWMRTIGTPEIPYDPALRRSKLAKAFRTLSSYIDAHERLGRSSAARLAAKNAGR